MTLSNCNHSHRLRQMGKFVVYFRPLQCRPILKFEKQAKSAGYCQYSAPNRMISESMLSAQAEADRVVDEVEKLADNIDENDELPEMPKFLALPAADLQQKTLDLKSRNQQLDLLLLKAESYSHFILSNQSINNEESDEALAKKPRKTSQADNQPQEFCQPQSLVGGQLLPYQLKGLQWLLSLWENGLSGILADEMGLATLPNWVNEFKKWLPSCPIVLYHGSKAERANIRRQHMSLSKQKDMSFPVVITSFEMCILDRMWLEKLSWQYLILDEGHRIKNRNCRLVKELKSIRSTSRLLLTGTPIQNTLEELWSLLNFCCPMIFDDLRVFQSWFGFKNIGKDTMVSDIVSTEQQQRIVSKLHEILRPFMLRRLKRDVMITLPVKKEVVLYCGMTLLQQEYYARVQDNTLRDALVAMNVRSGKDVSQMNKFMNLRKVCNHPFLFGEPNDEKTGDPIGVADPRTLISASGKFKLLDQMLTRLKADNHKVLIFSQMTGLMDILEDYLLHKNYHYCRLDGSTKLVDRQEQIDLFNSDPGVFVFILSTRAGGLGINLTAADTCILFDSDWNPHADLQAQDRCHRIGQRQAVVVYRLVTARSVEVDMIDRQASKRKLERLTVTGGDYRAAGVRSGAPLTLSRLRQLLEDDIKNLSRMAEDSSSLLNHIDQVCGSSSSCSSSSASSLLLPSSCNDISSEEFRSIMNRTLLMSGYLAKEGDMYDIVEIVGNTHEICFQG